jgi:cyclic pyranopterin monophosphate synthase
MGESGVPGEADTPGGTWRSLSHVDAAGRARMVDVTDKPWTQRRALAKCRVFLAEPSDAAGPDAKSPGEYTGGSWTDVAMTAKLAGIQAAKQTSRLVPLCHPLTVSHIDVRVTPREAGFDIEGEAQTVGPTGVEMEALTACAIAALSIVSAVHSRRVDARVEDLALWEKSGGRSGTWVRRAKV